MTVQHLDGECIKMVKAHSNGTHCVRVVGFQCEWNVLFRRSLRVLVTISRASSNVRLVCSSLPIVHKQHS